MKASRRASSSRSVCAIPAATTAASTVAKSASARPNTGSPTGRATYSSPQARPCSTIGATTQQPRPRRRSAATRWWQYPALPSSGPCAVSTQASGSPPPAHRSWRNSVISANWCTGYDSSSGNSSSPSASSPTFTSTRSRPSSRSHTDSAATLPPRARQAPAPAARHASPELCAAAMP